MAPDPERPIGLGPIGEGPIGPQPEEGAADPILRRALPDLFWPTSRAVAVGAAVLGTASLLLQPTVPFTQGDWPVTRRVAALNQSYVADFPLTLTTHRPPSIQRDWPVPRGAARLTALGWIDHTSPLTLGQLTPPPEEVRWAVPRGPKPVVASWQASFPLPLQETIQPNQYDWPNPRGVVRTSDLTFSQSLVLNATFAPPFFQTDWPNPRGPRRVVADFNKSGLSVTTAPLGTPFTQKDWQNPRGRVPGISLRTWTDSFKLTLTTHRPPSVQDRPNPRGREYPVALRTWTHRQTHMIGQDVLPKRQTDWPNPRGKIPAQKIESGPRIALQVGLAFKQTQWPNPQGHLRRDLRGWTDSFKLPLQSVRPNNQKDWQNPRGPRRSEQLSWRGDPFRTLTFAAQTPHHQDLWPVPRGPRRLTALGWTDRAEPGTIPPAEALTLARPQLGLQVLRRLLLTTSAVTGPNIVVSYPFPPPPEPPAPPAPPKTVHASVSSGDTKTSARTRQAKTQVTGRKARTSTSSRWVRTKPRSRRTKTEVTDP